MIAAGIENGQYMNATWSTMGWLIVAQIRKNTFVITQMNKLNLSGNRLKNMKTNEAKEIPNILRIQ
jgi:hypothetical protein